MPDARRTVRKASQGGHEMAWGSVFTQRTRSHGRRSGGGQSRPRLVANSPAAMSCDRVASPSGSDSAAGSVASPYRTAQKLVDSLGAGPDRLPAGRPVRAGRDGQQAAAAQGRRSRCPAIRASAPPCSGRLRVKDSANFVTVESLDLDGRDADEPAEPERLRRRRRVPRQRRHELPHTAICFLLGSNDYGRAKRDDDRAQPDPRLRRAARAEPRPRDLHRGLGRRPRDRQLDLRQRRPGRADVPRLAGHATSRAT